MRANVEKVMKRYVYQATYHRFETISTSFINSLKQWIPEFDGPVTIHDVLRISEPTTDDQFFFEPFEAIKLILGGKKLPPVHDEDIIGIAKLWQEMYCLAAFTKINNFMITE